MDRTEAFMMPTSFDSRYGISPSNVRSARQQWQYDRTTSTVPNATLRTHYSNCCEREVRRVRRPIYPFIEGLIP